MPEPGSVWPCQHRRLPVHSDPGTGTDLGPDATAGAVGFGHPVAVARDLAERLLAPAAADCDTGSVPQSHVRPLAEGGLLGLTAGSVSMAVAREVLEALAGACAATWFVALQHWGTAARVQRLSDRLVRRLASPSRWR